MRKEDRRKVIVLMAQERRHPKNPTARATGDSALRLFQKLVLTGLIRPRRVDSWRIILAAPPAGPRAS